MPTAAYLRVSSARQREEQTIESQWDALSQAAAAAGHVVDPSHVYRDEGIGGGTLQRPELDRLRDAIAQGIVNRVWVYAPDRLSRKYAYQVLLLEEWERAGCAIHFVRQPPAQDAEGALLTQIQGIIAEYERAQIQERTRRGKLYKARQGSVNVLGGAPYGYHYTRRADGVPAEYTIHPTEAAVVRQVFAWFTEQRWSLGEIVRELQRRAVPTRTGKTVWDRATIWGLLRNPAYKGQAAFGKTRTLAERPRLTRPVRLAGRVTSPHPARRDRPAPEWILIPVPALVDDVCWEAAQRQLAENQRLAPRHTKTPSICQGLAVCAECRYSYYRTSTRSSKQKIGYYRCLGTDRWRWSQGAVCSSRPIRQDILDGLVWTAVTQLLTDPGALRDEWNRRQQINPSHDEILSSRATTELRRLDQSRQRLVDAYQEDLLPLVDFRARVQRLDERHAALEQELAQMMYQQQQQALYDHAVQSWDAFRQSISDRLEDLTVPEQQHIVRLVVREVEVGQDSIIIHHIVPTHPPHTAGYRLCWRSHHATLWGADQRGLGGSVFEDPGRQHLPQPPQHGAIGNPVRHAVQQRLVVDGVKKCLNIGIDHPVIPLE